MKTLLLLLLVSTLSFANNQDIDRIAVVDTAMVLDSYNKRIELENELSRKKEALNLEITSVKESILDLEKKALHTRDRENIAKELTTLKTSLDLMTREAKEELKTLYSESSISLQRDVAIAVNVVGRELGYSVVFHKNATFYGGYDITKEVTSFLNSGEKIPLNLKPIINDL